MPSFLKISLVALSLMGFSIPSFAQDRGCFTMEVHRHKLIHDSAYRESIKRSDVFSSPLNEQGIWSKSSSMTDSTLVIPVVVHVLYNSPEQNISAEQIQSQIDVLNEDFAVLNPTALDVPSEWSALKQDSKIRFRLAQRDPEGNFTTGITRHFTYRSQFAILDPDIYIPDSGGVSAWPNSKYLNIWVCNLEFNALGFASFPGSSASNDGIVISYKSFGRIGPVNAPYDLGRTTTHEAGHWFSLQHIWGDEDGCSGTDNVDDTPNQEKSTFRCPRFPKTDNCTVDFPGIMYMNYMDYTDDKCMMFFTQGQISKMREAAAAYRDSLFFSNGHILPAPLSSDLAIDSVLSPVLLANERCLIPEILIRNNGLDSVSAFTINYGLAGDLKKSFSWSGLLPPGDIIPVKLPQIGTGLGSQVMEFRITENDDNRVNNFRSSGFKLNPMSLANCISGGISAYPNPVTGQKGVCIKMQRSVSQESTLSMFNSMGQLVYQTSTTINPGDAVPIDFTGLARGVYVVSITGDQYNESIKVISLPAENAAEGMPDCF